MANPSSYALPSKSLMIAAAVITVIGAGVAGFLAFAPSKEPANEAQAATPAQTTTDTDIRNEPDPGLSEPAPSLTASQEGGEDVAIMEATSRSEAEEQSKKRRCYQNRFPVDVIQKLNDDTFFAYSRFAVGDPLPILLTFVDGERPTSSGFTVLSPRDGLLIGVTETVQMETGFSRKASVLRVGDKRCAGLWSVIEKGLLADRVTSETTPATVPRRSAVRERSDELRKAESPPTEDRAGEATAVANAAP